MRCENCSERCKWILCNVELSGTGTILCKSGLHPLIAYSFPRHGDNQKHPHKYPKYPAGGSTAPFENHHPAKLAEPRIPSAWMGPSGTQPCSRSPGGKLSPDLPRREASEGVTEHASLYMRQRPGYTVQLRLPPRIMFVDGSVSKRDSHTPNGPPLLLPTLCPGAQPTDWGWSSCPG